MDIEDLAVEDPRLLSDALPVLLELRPHLRPEDFVAIYAEGHPQGLRFTAGYSDGECVVVAGWRVIALTHHGRKLYVDDLVTSSAKRSLGAGKAMLEHLAEVARAAGCRVIDLDSGTHRLDAHRFYCRERMPIVAFHFSRDL
ncbi:MAG: GNAT family N-acetyltransferase [Sporichthyaceae bacterium]|jgi:GNAT superfamily N-acetyltransferase